MQFRALTDLFLPAPDCRYVQAGQIISDEGVGIPIPSSWQPPTNGVTPLTPDATERYWEVGPRGMMDAQPYQVQFTNGSRWSDIPVSPATIYWVPVNPKNPALGFVLTGGGGNLGPRPPM
jgi:hypothetical protein